MQIKAFNPLPSAIRFWFIVICLGQSLFVFYILLVYYKSTVLGNLEKWNTVNSHFYIQGDITGNLVFAVHVAFAAVITILGPMQLVPALRARVPRFHRISGRIYIASALLISMAGIYLTWVRGAVGGPVMAVNITANGLIIIICACFTILRARQRRFKAHQQWAVHLFLGMSGVWFFRVFFMLWMLIHQAPVGFDPATFTGPFLTALSVLVYIIPQGIAAVYFHVKHTGTSAQRALFALFVFIVAIGMAVGSMGAAVGMWMPKIWAD